MPSGVHGLGFVPLTPNGYPHLVNAGGRTLFTVCERSTRVAALFAEPSSDEVKYAAQKIRRLVGFSIADLKWIQDHALELAHRYHCDSHGGFPAGGRVEVRGDNRNDDGSKTGPVPELASRRSQTSGVDGFMDLLLNAREAASLAKKGTRHLRVMTKVAAREATEVKRGTLPPGLCSNCGRRVYPPAEYLRFGECPACYKYRQRTGKARSVK
jgi:hypothetical protein